MCAHKTCSHIRIPRTHSRDISWVHFKGNIHIFFYSLLFCGLGDRHEASLEGPSDKHLSKCVCVCVCVCERERERERDRTCARACM